MKWLRWPWIIVNDIFDYFFLEDENDQAPPD